MQDISQDVLFGFYSLALLGIGYLVALKTPYIKENEQ